MTITDYSQQSSPSSSHVSGTPANSHGIYEDFPGLNPNNKHVERIIELYAGIYEQFAKAAKEAGLDKQIPNNSNFK
ncbi:hypothetical protein PSY31_23075, partial [Shigella flexneri]|nr:hypothetical protein [Shigella flexneri]